MRNIREASEPICKLELTNRIHLQRPSEAWQIAQVNRDFLNEIAQCFSVVGINKEFEAFSLEFLQRADRKNRIADAAG